MGTSPSPLETPRGGGEAVRRGGGGLGAAMGAQEQERECVICMDDFSKVGCGVGGALFLKTWLRTAPVWYSVVWYRTIWHGMVKYTWHAIWYGILLHGVVWGLVHSAFTLCCGVLYSAGSVRFKRASNKPKWRTGGARQLEVPE